MKIYRIEVALEYRPPPIRSRIKPENFILKAIDNRISSNIGRQIATEKTYKPRPVLEEIRYIINVRGSYESKRQQKGEII